MRCGLFGKLPSKRDFVTVNLPREFVTAWEQWLEQCMSVSRTTHAENWAEVYSTAPFWRFWLGADVLGVSAAGVIMPSIDGVGRQFPLTIACCAGEGEAIVPAGDAGLAAWHDRIESFLLDLLDTSPSYEDMLRELDSLLPAPVEPAEDRHPSARLQDCHYAVACSAEALPAAIAATLASDNRRLLRKTGIWWTIGGEQFPPVALSSRGLPPEQLFATMLSGAFPVEPTE